MNLNALKRLVALGESSQLEFKRSTGELREALHTVCAFLNADGGKVLFGVRPDGAFVGQEVSDKTVRDIDREEVFRMVDAARTAGRLVEPVGKDLGRMLDRLGVGRRGILLRASIVLFGTRFLPDFPQCELRLARFRGTGKTEFLDQRQLRSSAFTLLEEAMLFCQRHLPLPDHIEPGRLERVDRPLIPPDALREIREH